MYSSDVKYTMNYGGVVYCMLTCILYRLGLLRNLFYRFQTVGPMVYKDSDNTSPHRKTSIRNHFYFFLEYILTSSLLPVGDPSAYDNIAEVKTAAGKGRGGGKKK